MINMAMNHYHKAKSQNKEFHNNFDFKALNTQENKKEN